MKDRDLARLKHMLDSTKAILIFLHGKKRIDLDTDRLLLPGVIRELQILGEAAGKISQKTQDLFPNLPWKKLIGMRNRLIHAYFDVDREIVWNTAKDHLPAFYGQLEAIVMHLETRT